MRCRIEATVGSRHSSRSREHVLKEVGSILARGLIASMHGVDGGRQEKAARALTPETAESLLKSNPNQPLTCSAIARALGVSNSTARNQLKPLLESGIVERHGRGPSTTYSHITKQ